jgi:hypothetical protein
MTTGVFCYDRLEHDLTHPWFPVLLVMRVYALYVRNKWVLCFVALECAAATVLASVRAKPMTTTLAFHSWQWTIIRMASEGAFNAKTPEG